MRRCGFSSDIFKTATASLQCSATKVTIATGSTVTVSKRKSEKEKKDISNWKKEEEGDALRLTFELNISVLSHSLHLYPPPHRDVLPGATLLLSCWNWGPVS